MSYTISPDGKAITCHKCGLTSHNLNDVANRYCDKCRVFHDDMKVLDVIADTVLAYRPKTKKRKPELRPASLRKAWPDPTPEMLDDPLFNAIWIAIKTWDIGVPKIYAGYCGATGNHARAIYDALPQAEREREGRLIRRAVELMRTSELPHNRMATLEEEIDMLKGEIASERDARHKSQDALRRKDEAMGILFERLRAAGVDCSDLIP